MYLTQKKREIEDHRGMSLNIMDVLRLLNEYCNTAEISEVKMSGKSRKEDENKHFKTNKERREEQRVKKVMAQQAVSTNNSPKTTPDSKWKKNNTTFSTFSKRFIVLIIIFWII